MLLLYELRWVGDMCGVKVRLESSICIECMIYVNPHPASKLH